MAARRSIEENPSILRPALAAGVNNRGCSRQCIERRTSAKRALLLASRVGFLTSLDGTSTFGAQMQVGSLLPVHEAGEMVRDFTLMAFAAKRHGELELNT